MLTAAAETETAMRGTLDAAKRAVPHLIAHKVASTIAAAAKKQKRVDMDVGTKPRASVEERFHGYRWCNAQIDGSGIVLD